MKKIILTFATLFFLISNANATDVSPVVDKLLDSVVLVINHMKADTTPVPTIRSPLPGRRRPETTPEHPTGGEKVAFGTGFFISKDGYIVTNNHVIKNGASYEVKFKDGVMIAAKVIASDEASDIAILKISPFREFHPVKWGSSTSLTWGKEVIAIGNPRGFETSVTLGIVSHPRRMGLLPYTYYIQTDTSVNRGNSGGPLFNISGEVVGITSMIISSSGGSEGIALAIPGDYAQEIVHGLLTDGSIKRSKIGINIQSYYDTINEAKYPKGVEVLSTEDGSPGKLAGLKEHDVIVKYGNIPVQTPFDLVFNVTRTKPNTVVPVTIIRDKHEMVLSVKVTELPVSALIHQTDDDE